MSTDSQQENERLYVPLEGTYVSFKLEPEATFKHFGCTMDKIAETALKSFPRKTYLGYVSYSDDLRELPMPDRTYNKVWLCPLQHGLTAPIPDSNITPEMCAPVLPETRHPRDRPALKTNKPLPWDSCYHPTCMSIQAWLPLQWDNYSSVYQINSLDRCKMLIYVDRDGRAREGIIDEEDEEDEDEETEGMDYDSVALSDGPSGWPGDEYEGRPGSESLSQHLQESDGEIPFPTSVHDRQSSASGDDISIQKSEYHSLQDQEWDFCDGRESVREEIIGQADEGKQPEHTYPVVSFSTDIEKVTSLHSALELDQDFLHLRGLLKECRERAETVKGSAPDAAATPTEKRAMKEDKGTRPSLSSRARGYVREPGELLHRFTEKLHDLLRFPRVRIFRLVP